MIAIFRLVCQDILDWFILTSWTVDFDACISDFRISVFCLSSSHYELEENENFVLGLKLLNLI